MRNPQAGPVRFAGCRKRGSTGQPQAAGGALPSGRTPRVRAPPHARRPRAPAAAGAACAGGAPSRNAYPQFPNTKRWMSWFAMTRKNPMNRIMPAALR